MNGDQPNQFGVAACERGRALRQHIEPRRSNSRSFLRRPQDPVKMLQNH